jgi:nitrite reductase/ring-hydroxylating ferredoxin subunit
MDENIYNDEKLHIMNENICSHMTCIHDYVDNDGENVICESS